MDDLCNRILRAESEAQVHEILSALPSDYSWRPLDRRDTNWNITENQAASGAKALTELCTNMVDAIILRHADEAGVGPDDPRAPKNVIEAIRDLVPLPGAHSGILAEVDDVRTLLKYARANLVIAVTGETGVNARPCFTFIDTGEGQHPDAFEDTFLSLSSPRKSKIPYVQGKYNMGSSGVLAYCGRQGYKLIVSRHHSEEGPWGWTLVRQRSDAGPPVAEYLLLNGMIPRFETDSILPMVRQDRVVDSEIERRSGTIIKLYSYVLGRAADFISVREALNDNLISTILPFRLMDYRATPRKSRKSRRTDDRSRRAVGVDERPLNGMWFQLMRPAETEDDESDVEPGKPIHVGDVDHPLLGQIRITGVILGKRLPRWLDSRNNISRVFHAVNGQIQHKESRGYLSRQCRLPGLKDRVVILVDASDLKPEVHHRVWKGDRETIHRTEIGSLYEEIVTQVIRGSEALRDLEQRIAREDADQATKAVQLSLFESVVAADPNIEQLLPEGDILRLPGRLRSRKLDSEDFIGRYSPSYARIIGRVPREQGIDVALRDRRRIVVETDAANDWLHRADNRGTVKLAGNAAAAFEFDRNLHDGRLAISLRPLEDAVTVGDTFSTGIVLQDGAMPEPLEGPLSIRIVAERETKRSGSPSRKRRNASDDGEDLVEARGLPQTRWMTLDGRDIGSESSEEWPEGYSEQDGGEIREQTAGEKLYVINYDNAHFRHFLDQEKDDAKQRVIIEQFRLSMLVLMMGFEDACSRATEISDRDGFEDWIDDVRRLVARGAATVVMSIAKTLPQMVTSETVTAPDDD